MKLINNDFRIIETYIRKKYDESYLVERLEEPGSQYFIKILEPFKASECIEDFIINFPFYAEVRHRFLLYSYEFGLIKNLNLKPTVGRLYYVLSEYIDWECLKINYKKLSITEMAKIFAMVAETLDYLHFRGIIYTILSPEKIFPAPDGTVRIANLSTSIEHTFEKERLNAIQEFVAPEVFSKSDGFDARADHYSLGKLLEIYLLPLLKDSGDKRADALKEIINNLTARDPEHRSVKLSETIVFLESTFGFDIGTNLIEDREKLHLDHLSQVGHDTQLKELEELESLIKQNSCIYNCVVIEGNNGSGKSYLLDSFIRRTELRGSLTAKISIPKFKTMSSNHLADFLCDFLSAIGISHELYSAGEYLKIELNDKWTAFNITNITELFKLYGMMTDYLINKSRSTAVVIGMKYLESADIQILEMLDFIVNRLKNSRVLVVFTYSDGKIERSNRSEWLEEWFNRNNVLKIRTSNLTLEATGRLVKYILGISFVPRNFSQILYRESLGNLRYFIYLMRYLLEIDEIYINERGTWSIRKENYEDLYFPKSFSDTFKTRIDALGDRQHGFLKVLSCFEGNARADILRSLTGLKQKDFQQMVDALDAKKLIIVGGTEQVAEYRVAEIEIQRYIYKSLDVDFKLDIHSKIAEKLKSLEKEESFDELFYQFACSNNFDDLLEMVYSRLEKEKNKFSDAAILIIRKAYEVFSRSEHPGALKMLDKLCYSYLVQGDANSLSSYIDKLEIMSIERSDEKYFIRSLLYRLEMTVRENDIPSSKRLIERIGEKIENTDFYEEKIYLQMLIAKFFLDIDNQPEALIAVGEGIRLSEKHEIKIYEGDLYNIRAITKYMSGDAKTALLDFEAALKGYEESDRPFDMVKPINNIGSIQGEFYGSEKLALDYYWRSVEISEKYGLLALQTTLLCNIGEAYTNVREYDNAEGFLDQAIELSKRTNDKKSLFMSYVMQAIIYLRKGLISKSLEIYNILKIMNNTAPILDKEILMQYNNYLGQFYFETGKLKLSKEFSKISMEKSKDISKKEHMKARMRLLNIEFIENRMLDVKKINEMASDFRTQGSPYDRAYYLLLCALISYYQDSEELTLQLLSEYNSISNKEVKTKYENDYTLIKAIIDGSEDSLKRALDISEKIEGDRVIPSYYSNLVIGSKLAELGNYETAIQLLMKNLDWYETAIVALGKENLGEQYTQVYLIDFIIPQLDQCLNNYLNIDRDFEPTISNYLKAIPEEAYMRIFSIDSERECKYDINALVRKLDGNADDNIRLILKFLSLKTGADYGFIDIYETDSNGHRVYSYKEKPNYIMNTMVENAVKEGKNIFVKREPSVRSRNIFESYIEPEITAFIVIPILQDPASAEFNFERRQAISRNKVYGHILLMSKSNINRFDNNALELVKDLTGLILLNAENEKLFLNSYFDRLTGMLRRSIAEKRLEEAIKFYNVDSRGFACLILDIDRFKIINDTYGHQVGDKVLAYVGDTIKKSIRITDTAARYGGEEFLIILEDVDSNAAKSVAEKIRKAIEEMEVQGLNHNITVSIGISVYPEDGQISEDLIFRADQAMYFAKEVLGRNKTALWNDEMESVIGGAKFKHDLIFGGLENESDRTLALTETAILSRENKPLSAKLQEFLGFLLDSTRSQYGVIYRYSDHDFEPLAIKKKNWSIRQEDKLVELFERVVKSRESESYIDWETVYNDESGEKTREYISGAISPIVFSGKTLGLILIETSLQKMEFRPGDLKFIEIMGSVFAPNLVEIQETTNM